MEYCAKCGHLKERHGVKGNQGPCEVCDCKGYGSLSRDPEPPHVPSPRDIAEKEIYPALKEWAYSYNAYERISGKNWGALRRPTSTSKAPYSPETWWRDPPSWKRQTPLSSCRPGDVTP